MFCGTQSSATSFRSLLCRFFYEGGQKKNEAIAEEQLEVSNCIHMKEENYAAAVDCYTQAIELDSNNAVYYCNR